VEHNSLQIVSLLVLTVTRLSCSVLQYDAVYCSVLQCVAMRCSVLQCVAVPSSFPFRDYSMNQTRSHKPPPTHTHIHAHTPRARTHAHTHTQLFTRPRSMFSGKNWYSKKKRRYCVAFFVYEFMECCFFCSCVTAPY